MVTGLKQQTSPRAALPCRCQLGQCSYWVSTTVNGAPAPPAPAFGTKTDAAGVCPVGTSIPIALMEESS